MATTTVNLTGIDSVQKKKKLLLIGDSITAQGYSISPSIRYRNLGWWVWCNAFCNWTFEVVNVSAVSGWTSSQVLSDLESSLQTHQPDWVWGIIGQNDLGLSNPSLCIQNISDVSELCNEYGAKLMIGTVTPRTSMSSTVTSDLYVINKGIRDMAREGKFLLFDSHASILDADSLTGLANSSFLYDTLHPNPYGAWRIGKKAYELISNVVDLSDYSSGVSSGDDRTVVSNSPIINKNSKLAGTSGSKGTGATGDVASSWFLGRSSGTGVSVVGSKVDISSDSSEEISQKIDFSGTSAGSDEIRLQQTVALSALASPVTVGVDTVRARAKVKLSSLSSNLTNCRLVVESINAVPASSAIGISMIDNGFDLASQPSDWFTIETPAGVIPADCVSLRISIFTKFSSGSVSGSIEVSNIFMELI